MKITIIGAGNMGGAIARGLAKGTIFAENEITCTAKSTATLEKLRSTNPQINLTTSNASAVAGADIILFAVKPWLMKEVIEQVKPYLAPDRSQIYISVAAGIPCQQLEEWIESYNVIRVIPNTAIEIGESMTFITASDLSMPQIKLVEQIFSELGNTMIVPESQLAACTALASCGIAFAMRYIQASAQGGVEIGIKASDAQKIVEHTVIGAAKLLMAKEAHPAVEIDKVTTPGGITIRGLNEMEHAGFTSSVIRGLKECVK
jgi:pyrroline-5-carboxylate reductase